LLKIFPVKAEYLQLIWTIFRFVCGLDAGVARVLDGFGLSEWVWLVVTGEKCRCSEQVFVELEINFSRFAGF